MSDRLSVAAQAPNRSFKRTRLRWFTQVKR